MGGRRKRRSGGTAVGSCSPTPEDAMVGDAASKLGEASATPHHTVDCRELSHQD